MNEQFTAKDANEMSRQFVDKEQDFNKILEKIKFNAERGEFSLEIEFYSSKVPKNLVLTPSYISYLEYLGFKVDKQYISINGRVNIDGWKISW